MRLATVALLALSCASPALAQHVYTNADLVGGHAFAIGPKESSGEMPGDMSDIGVLVFDGTGAVTSASRTVLRHEGQNGRVLGTYSQTGTGTYSVLPDGTGTIQITWSPELPTIQYSSGSPYDYCRVYRWEPTSAWHVVLTDTGFSFVRTEGMQYVVSCPPPVNQDNGSYPFSPLVVSGMATRQDGPCANQASSPAGSRVVRTR